MQLIQCGPNEASAIQRIFNQAIVDSTALYEYQPRSLQRVQQWLEDKSAAGLPVLGVLSSEGLLMGFASFGPFRAFPAYKYTVEHSLYVDQQFRGRGVGAFLLQQLIQQAKQRQLHVLIGAIDSQNLASIHLHQKFGFELTGTMPEVGYKFGRWLNLSFYQLILETPTAPVDG